MDGTLIDSRAYHWRSWRDALQAEPVTITEADFLASFGQRNDAILRAWLGPDVDPERIRRIGEAKEVRYRQIVEEEGIDPLPGAGEWVRLLHGAGWRQAIASSAPRLNVEAVARVLDFAGDIDVVVAAEDVTAGKPDPEVFLTAAARLGALPARCVVVEDAAAGIEAARRAQMRSIGVGGEALAAADVVVNALADLPEDAFERLVER